MRTELIERMIERCKGMDMVQANVRVLQGTDLSTAEYAVIRSGIIGQLPTATIRQSLLGACIERIQAGSNFFDEARGCNLTDAEKDALAAQVSALPVAPVAAPQVPAASAMKNRKQAHDTHGNNAPKAHDFVRRSANLYTDQHGCAGTVDDSRTLNGKIYFHWKGDENTPNRIFTLTLAEAEQGFRITERNDF